MITLEELEKEFNLIKSKTPKPKNYFPKKRGRNYFANSNLIQKNTYKQVVIKTIGKGIGQFGVKRALDYISKSADGLYLENEKGEKLSVDDIYNEWKIHFAIQKNTPKSRIPKEAMHLIFSIDEDIKTKNLEALAQSVRDTMKINLYEYKYAMAVHTHQNKPHVHIILNKRNTITGRKLSFKTRKNCKDFFTQMREDFKENLNYYNKDFNYENRFKVDRNLEIALLQEYIEKTNRENYIFKQLSRDSSKNISRFKSKYNDTKNNIKDFLEGISKTTALSFSLLKNKDIYEIERNASSYEKYKRKQNFFKKKIKHQTLLHQQVKVFNKKIDSSELISKLKMLEYFDMPQQKKLLTKKQRQTLVALKRSYSFAKLNFIKQTNLEFDSKENEIREMAKKSNAFAIIKHLRNIDERMIEMEVMQDNKSLDRLVKNKKFLLDLLEKRFLQNKKTINFVERKILVAERKEEIEELKKSIDFLVAERKIMEDRFAKYTENANRNFKKEEVQKISNMLEIEFDEDQDIDEFLLKNRPAYIALRKNQLEKYATRISKELKIERGELEAQQFVDKYSPRYRFKQNLLKVKKIVKKLNLQKNVEEMNTKAVHEFLEEHKETYEIIVREGIEKFVGKIADENGRSLPKNIKDCSNSELWEWIEKNNIRSKSREMLEKLVLEKIKLLEPVFVKEKEAFEKARKEDEKMPKELLKQKRDLENLENLLKKTETIAPIFPSDLRAIDKTLEKRIITNECIKEIPITIEATESTDQLFLIIKEVMPKLELDEDQQVKIEKFLNFASKKNIPVAKSYLKKFGFLNHKAFQKIHFEPHEKSAPSIKMPEIYNSLEIELRNKNIPLPKKELEKENLYLNR